MRAEPAGPSAGGAGGGSSDPVPGASASPSTAQVAWRPLIAGQLQPPPGGLLDPEPPAVAADQAVVRVQLQRRLEALGLSPDDWRRAAEGIPPALPAERSAQRRAEQAAALAAIEARLTALAPARASAGLEELWSIGAADPQQALQHLRLFGALGRSDFALRLGAALPPSSSGRRVAAARRGLYELYGYWFADQAELAPFLQPTVAPAGGPQREILRQLLAERVALYQRLWEHDAKRALEVLGHASPRLRSEAARRLSAWAASSLASTDPARGEVLRALHQAWSCEADESAFAAQLEAAAQLWPALPSDALDLLQARQLLTQATLVAPDSLLHVLARAWLQLPGLPALPAADGEAATLALQSGSAESQPPALAPHDLGFPPNPHAKGERFSSQWEALESLFLRLWSTTARDVDVSVALIEVLRQWARGQADLPRAIAARAVEPLLQLLRDPTTATALRSAAAAAMRELAQVEDVQALCDVLEAPAEAGLRFTLLQVLERIADAPGLQPSGADRMVQTAVALQQDGDAEVRRRALALLGKAPLAARLAVEQRYFLLERLEAEPNADLCAELLAHLTSCDWPEEPTALLRPRVMELVAAEVERNDVRNLDRLAECLARQLAGNPEQRLAAARRWMELAPEAARARYAARAFALAAPADGAELDALASALGDPREPHLVELLHWATLLAELKLEQRLMIERGRAERLLECAYSQLLPRAVARGALNGPGQRLFEARLAPAVERLSVPQVQAAIEAAQAESPAVLELELERSAARFLCARGEQAAALETFARLLERGDRSGSPGAELTCQDWRQLLELALAVEGSAHSAEQAIALGRRAALALVAHQEWPATGPGQALKDLEHAVLAVEDAKDQTAARVLRVRLEELMAVLSSSTPPGGTNAGAAAQPGVDRAPGSSPGPIRGADWANQQDALPRLETLAQRLTTLESRQAPDSPVETGGPGE